MFSRSAAVLLAAVTVVGCPYPFNPDVDPSIVSVSLANDCPQAERAQGMTASDCAPGVGECSLPCQQSSVQLALKARPKAQDTMVDVGKVWLIDAATNQVVDELTARSPSVWNGTSYITWNSVLKGGDDVRISYLLSSPDWAKIGGGDAWKTHSMRFRLRVELKLNGAVEIIESGELAREPEVVT